MDVHPIREWIMGLLTTFHASYAFTTPLGESSMMVGLLLTVAKTIIDGSSESET
tara:strand:+ start:1568 stop:1729 length:162 start_codon:yes stop_codon:yes gene_type:complete